MFFHDPAQLIRDQKKSNPEIEIHVDQKIGVNDTDITFIVIDHDAVDREEESENEQR
jgi:hypothetical protein